MSCRIKALPLPNSRKPKDANIFRYEIEIRFTGPSVDKVYSRRMEAGSRYQVQSDKRCRQLHVQGQHHRFVQRVVYR